jgi:hypothetical protein
MDVERGLAHQGDTVRLRMRFKLAEVLTDPVDVRQVEIRRSDLSLLSTIASAAIVHDGTGLYHVDYAIPDDEPTDLHHDRWYGTLTTGATEKQFTLSFLVLAFTGAAGGSYLSLDEAQSYLADGTDLTDPQVEALVARAVEIVEDITGQNFVPRTETRTFSGSGQQILNLRRPIRSISSIVCLGSPPGNGDIDLDLSDIRIGESGTTIACGNIRGGMFRRRSYLSLHLGGGSGGYWSRGFSNIQVTGEWGAYDTCPASIKHAVGLLVRYMGECDDPQGGEAAFESEKVEGDRDYTIRKIWNNVTQNAITGYSDVDAILARYMAAPVVVGVV